MLNFFATLAQIGKNWIDSKFVDDSHAFTGKSQPYPAIFAFHPETVVMQVGKEATLGPVVSVRYVESGYWPLSGNLANFGHCIPLILEIKFEPCFIP